MKYFSIRLVQMQVNWRNAPCQFLLPLYHTKHSAIAYWVQRLGFIGDQSHSRLFPQFTRSKA